MPIGTVWAGRSGPPGPAGPATQWQSSGGFLQYRPVGGTTWTNVIAISALTAGATSAFTFKGQVANTGSLPGSGNTIGDAYLITGTANLYVWNGSSWVGPTNVAGPAGADGADGVGVPTAGTTGQVLAKNSNTNFDTEWIDPPAGSGTVTSVNGDSGPAVVLDADDLADGTAKKMMTAAERTKLTGIATGATNNLPDATLKDRTQHTGVMPVAGLHASVPLFAILNAGGTPVRPTNDPNRFVMWLLGPGVDVTTDLPLITSGTAGRYAIDRPYLAV